jgi:PAS domain-containing protein
VPIPLCNVCMLTKDIILINQRFVDVFGYTVDDVPTLNDWWLNAYPDPHYLVGATNVATSS